MTVTLIIIAVLLWLGALALLPGRGAIAPLLSFLALFLLSFARSDGYPLLPINGTILTAWLSMTLVVMVAAFLQPEAVRRQTRGMGYIIGGAVTGMVVGLLGFTFTSAASILYTVMILATVVGIFFGFLLYTRTPDGAPVALGSGNFFRYLLAKGFPTAITVMQIGVVLVLAISLKAF